MAQQTELERLEAKIAEVDSTIASVVEDGGEMAMLADSSVRPLDLNKLNAERKRLVERYNLLVFIGET